MNGHRRLLALLCTLRLALLLPAAAGAAEIVDRNVAAPVAAGQQPQRRARHLLGAGSPAPRPLLGRGRLGRHVQARLLRRLEEQDRRLQALQQQLQAVHRRRAAVHDRRLRRARRLALGAPAVAAPVEELRRRQGRRTSSTSRTGGARSASSRSRPTTATTASTSTCGARSRSTASRSSASSWTLAGVPLDKQGRNIYVDYLNGTNWHRVNSFLTHPPTAGFCYTFANHPASSPAWNGQGTGDAYRATAIGPGVTPLVQVHFAPPGPYERGDRRGRQRRAGGAARGRLALPHRLSGATRVPDLTRRCGRARTRDGRRGAAATPPARPQAQRVAIQSVEGPADTRRRDDTRATAAVTTARPQVSRGRPVSAVETWRRRARGLTPAPAWLAGFRSRGSQPAAPSPHPSPPPIQSPQRAGRRAPGRRRRARASRPRAPRSRA